MKTHLVIIGPPGAGKGTLSRAIRKEIDLPHISVGKILRKEIAKNSQLGQMVKEKVEKGELVDDVLVGKIIEKELLKDKCKPGFLLDGFPRTLSQAKMFDEITKKHQIPFDGVLHLNVDDDIIKIRTANRRYCKECGANYNLYDNPPKGDTCDKDGGELVRREDDDPKIVEKRLKSYHEQTEPVIEHYKSKKLLSSFDYTSPEDIAIRALIYTGIKDSVKKDTAIIANPCATLHKTISNTISRIWNFTTQALTCSKAQNTQELQYNI